MKKKFLVFAAIVVVFVSIACLSVSAAETVASGTCGADGDNLTWVLDDTGTLTISGEGEMADRQNLSNAPWCSYNRVIKKVIIGSGVTSIGKQPFLLCGVLSEINVDAENNYYKSIDGVLFNKDKTVLVYYPCEKKGTDYVIPSHVKFIGDFAFQGCMQLKNVSIHNEVTSIGIYAFNGAYSLSNVSISNSVMSIGYRAFYACTALESINVDKTNQNYTSDGGVLFDKEKTTLICYPAGKKDAEYVVPDGVTYIEDDAFYFCKSLTSVNISADVINIGDDAFDNCYLLTKATIYNRATTFGTRVFSDTHDDFTIYGYRNSTSQSYASENSHLFMALDAMTTNVYGDATGDGIIDNKDLVRIKKYLAAYDYDTDASTVDIDLGADANGDGVVDNKDLVRLKKYLAAYDYDTGTSSVVLGPAT